MWVECFLVSEYSSGSKPKGQYVFDTPISKELLREVRDSTLPVWCLKQPQLPCLHKGDNWLGHIAL